MFAVKSSFIGDFKVGDNINYNLRILKTLYRLLNEGVGDTKTLLCKPIIILNAAILEAVLHDFHARIRDFTNEGVSSLKEDIVALIRRKKIDKLKKYIESAKKHNLLGQDDLEFYEKMDMVRKLRNRVHIQILNDGLDRNEHKIFKEAEKILSEQVLEKVLKTMSEKHSRGDNYHSVDNFSLPWDEHYP